jgi:hypothetical protein
MLIRQSGRWGLIKGAYRLVDWPEGLFEEFVLGLGA